MVSSGFGDAGLNKVNQVSSLQGFRVVNRLMCCRTHSPPVGGSRRKHYLQSLEGLGCDHSGNPLEGSVCIPA